MREGCGGASVFPSYKDTGETFRVVSAGMSQRGTTRCSGGRGPPLPQERLGSGPFPTWFIS